MGKTILANLNMAAICDAACCVAARRWLNDARPTKARISYTFIEWDKGKSDWLDLNT